MRKIVSESGPQDYSRERAETVLRRLEILRRPDSDKILTEILLRDPKTGSEEREEEEERRWALHAAQFRRLDLRSALRQRLNRDLDRTMETVAGWPAHSSNPTFEEHYRSYPHLQPRDWDECLIAYVECGGVPNSLERKRLAEFGYLCDPKTRLAELLAAWK